MTFRLALLGLIVVAVLGAGYGYYWHYIAGRLATGIKDWADQQRTLGNRVAFEADAIAGFPFAFRTQLHHVDLGIVQPGGTATVTGDVLQAEMRPWNLTSIAVTSAAPVVLSLQSADPSRGGQRVTLQDGVAHIRLRKDGGLQSLDIAADGAELQNNALTYGAQKVLARVDLPEVVPADYHQPLFGFDVTATGVTLPQGQQAVTAAPIEQVAAVGSVMGPVPATSDLRSALTGWANAGGTMELRSFAFNQTPLAVTGKGTLTLDEALQPLGALTIQAQGLGETIALLQQNGTIDARAAKTGALMAQGLAKPDANGRPTVTVSLSLQQGFLWLGPIKLAPLPAVSW